jgi:hypothetical protein
MLPRLSIQEGTEKSKGFLSGGSVFSARLTKSRQLTDGRIGSEDNVRVADNPRVQPNQPPTMRLGRPALAA